MMVAMMHPPLAAPSQSPRSALRATGRPSRSGAEGRDAYLHYKSKNIPRPARFASIAVFIVVADTVSVIAVSSGFFSPEMNPLTKVCAQ
jgi:hypothetical protein